MRYALAPLVLLLSATMAQADFEIDDFSNLPIDLSFPVTTAGPANSASIVGAKLQVTPGVLSNKGVVWTTVPEVVTGGFSTEFDFEFVGGTGAGGSADGLAFVIQNSSVDAYGDHGGAMGYGGFLSSPDNGISNSLAIEIDDYANGGLNDPNGNHISVHTLFDLPNSPDEATASLGASSAIPDFGQFSGSHTVRIDYVPGELTIFFDDLTTPALTVVVNLSDVLESDQAWLGFTGAGGAAYQVEEVTRWTFSNGSPSGDLFRRGDINLDGGFDVSDAVFALAALFTPGSPPPACVDAGDTNDDGLFDVSDVVFGLAALFTPGASPPPTPGPDTCGPDPTTDSLDCSAPCP